MTRATSTDGRFAYTLYMRPTGAPFIHALDTVRGTAACIDLPTLGERDLSGARLTPPAGGRPLLVRGPGLEAVAVDVAARRARPAGAPPRRPSPSVSAAPSSAAHAHAGAFSGLGWLVALAAPVLLAAGLVAGLVIAGRGRRRREPGSAHHEVVA